VDIQAELDSLFYIILYRYLVHIDAILVLFFPMTWSELVGLI